MTSITGWRLYFDGAANQSGFGIGILLISPQGDHIPRSVRLAFSDHHRLTNNIVEYEACITGLETALDLGIRQPLLIETRSAPAYYCLIGEIEDQIELLLPVVQRCQECQMHGDLIHVLPSELHALASLGHFRWGIDIIGKISPSEVDTLTQEYGIQDHGSCIRETNGAIEAANKNIKRILRKMVETSRDCYPKGNLDRVGAGLMSSEIDSRGSCWLMHLDGNRWGPTLVRFVFIDWIYEHCGHGVILRLFFLASLPVSFRLHFASSHRLPVSPVSIISIHFAFPCVMMMRSSQSYQVWLSHLAHMVLRYLTLRTQGFGIIYWEIWAFVSHRFIHLLPLAYITVRVVSITSGDIEGHILSFHSVYLPQVHDQR
ncbi:hypothetical protein AAG906_019032 [Vitis piasezkii]